MGCCAIFLKSSCGQIWAFNSLKDFWPIAYDAYLITIDKDIGCDLFKQLGLDGFIADNFGTYLP